jgi:hypothetical protein
MSHHRTDSTQELLDTTNPSIIDHPGHRLSALRNQPYALVKTGSNVSIGDSEYEPYVNFHADLTSTTGVYDSNLRPTLPPTRPTSPENAIRGVSEIATDGGRKAWMTIFGA